MNKIIILLLSSMLFNFLSCSKSYERLSVLDPIKRSSSYLERFPANVLSESNLNSNEQKCFVDNYGIARIKSEIKELEKNYTRGTLVPRKFEFYKFNNAESHYLKRYAKHIYFNEASQNCTSLPCLLNIPYGDVNGEEGYRIYHWFLKMGIGISTLDEIPGHQRIQGRPVKDYLFPNEELKLFNMTSDIVSKSYKNILVSTLHRFPDGTSPGERIAGQYTYYPTSRTMLGTIFLTEQRVDLDNKSKLIEGYYFHTLVHELSHALDFTFGEEFSEKTHFSMKSKWLDLSWKWGESKVTKTKVKDGVEVEYEEVIMDWVVDEEKVKSEGFVRGYQRTNHKEDFADSGANFIISSKKMKKVSPKKLDIFKSQFYNEDSFLNSDEQVHISEYLSHDFKRHFWEILKDCSLADTQSFIPEKNTTFSYPASLALLKPRDRSCVKNNIEAVLFQKFSLHQLKRYQSCHLNTENRDRLIQSTIDKEAPIINELVNDIDGLDGLKEEWAEFKTKLRDTCDIRSIYLQNRKSEGAEGNYRSELDLCVNSVLAESFNQHDILREEAMSYKLNNTFALAKEKTEEDFRLISKGIESNFPDDIKKTLKNCSVNSSSFPRDSLNFTPINGGQYFVKKEVLNCINEGFYEDYDEAIRSYLNDIYNASPLGLEYISELYMQTYIDMFNIEIGKINDFENKNVKKHILKDSSVIFKEELNERDTLIDFFKTKNSSRFRSKIVESLSKYLQSLEIQTITLSANELAGEVVLYLEPILLKNSSKAASEETTSVNRYINKTEPKFVADLAGGVQWKSLTLEQLNREQMELLCQKEAPKLVSKYTTNIEFEFYNKSLVNKKLINSSCQKISKKYQLELENLRASSVEFNKRLTSYVHSNMDWKINISRDRVVGSCFKYVKNQYEARYNGYNFLSETSNDVKLQENICSDFSKSWSDLLSAMSESIKCMCKKPKPTHIDILDTDWNVFQDRFLDYLKEDLFGQIDERIEQAINSCIAKYPRVQFFVMKTKRKNCLLKISEKDFQSQETIVSRQYGITVRKKIKSLRENIDQYLK